MPDAMGLAVAKGEENARANAENYSFYWKKARTSPEGKLFAEVRKHFDVEASFEKLLKYLSTQIPAQK